MPYISQAYENGGRILPYRDGHFFETGSVDPNEDKVNLVYRMPYVNYSFSFLSCAENGASASSLCRREIPSMTT